MTEQYKKQTSHIIELGGYCYLKGGCRECFRPAVSSHIKTTAGGDFLCFNEDGENCSPSIALKDAHEYLRREKLDKLKEILDGE